VNNVAPLILTLIDTNRQATDEEMQQIIGHVAQAPFSSRPLKMHWWLHQELADRGFQGLSDQ